jgi:type III restriction enzyme
MALLIQERPGSIQTSWAMAFEIEEACYAPYNRCENHRFEHHAFQLVGAMNIDELKCATKIDANGRVKRWLRNADRESVGGFWLPKSPGRFFPDFVVELKDGTIVVVEYKNPTLNQAAEEQHKKAVGELWAERSAGQCRFAWVVGEDWAALDNQFRIGATA